jgi:hypothetical protein
MAIYTRKTFISVSNILNEFVEDIDEITFLDLVEAFGDLFYEDNPNFDFAKFREACTK